MHSENAGVDHSQNVLNTKNWMINRDKAQKEKEDSQKEKEKEERENQEKQKGLENQVSFISIGKKLKMIMIMKLK